MHVNDSGQKTSPLFLIRRVLSLGRNLDVFICNCLRFTAVLLAELGSLPASSEPMPSEWDNEYLMIRRNFLRGELRNVPSRWLIRRLLIGPDLVTLQPCLTRVM